MDSNLLRVAGAQIPVCTDIEANVETIMRAIDFAGTEQADILLTPKARSAATRPISIQPPLNEHWRKSPPPPPA